MAKFNLRRDEKHVEKMFKDAMAEPTRYGKYLKSKLTDDQILELWKAMNIIKNASIEKLLTFDEAHGCITEDGDGWAWDLSGDFEDSLTEPYWEDEDNEDTIILA
jgi:hypothetical protein